MVSRWIHLLRWYPVAVVFGLWELLSRSGWIPRRLMPGIADIGRTFIAEIESGDIPYHAAISLGRSTAGLALAILLGVALGILLARSRWANRLLAPIFSFGYPVPKIALYPIFIFVFGLGSLSKIALVFLECLYPITISTWHGVQGLEQKHLWTARNVGATERQIFWKVLVPGAAPAIFAGMRVALPISLIVVIITEMIGESRGLGYFIAYATASFEYTRAFAGVLTIAIIGFLLDRAFVLLRNRVVFWERSDPVH